MEKQHEKVLEKVKKLLALSQSPSEAEASSALEKAHALLAEHNLSIADIKEDVEIEEDVLIDGVRLPNWKKLLAISVTRANYCDVILRSKIEFNGVSLENHKKLNIVGKAHNSIVARAMVEYLFATIERLAKKVKGKSAKESYKLGVAHNLAKRLKAITDAEKAPNSGLSGLVVYESGKVKDYLDGIGGKTSKVKSSVSNSNAYRAGFADGANVSLNRQVASGQGSQPVYLS